MSFVTALRTSRLPEKPWQTGPVLRLVISIIIGMMMGGVVAAAIRYFETPETSSVSEFLALTAGAFVSLAAGIVILSRPWPEDPNIIKLIVLLALIQVGIFLTWATGKMIKGDMELKNPIITMVIAVLAFQGLALVLVHFFLRRHLTNWREGFGLNLHPGQSLFIGIGAGILVVYPVLRLNDFCFHLFERLTLHPQEQPAVEILRGAETLLGRAATGIATVFLAPIGEEVIFRGILYPWAKQRISRSIPLWGTAIFIGAIHLNLSILVPLTLLAVLFIVIMLIMPTAKEIIFDSILGPSTNQRFSKPAALWSTAIVFGAIHLNLSSFIPLTVLALLLVWLYEYTGNLLAPIAVHVVFNGTNFIALFFQQK